jgi:hypothetical protein
LKEKNYYAINTQHKNKEVKERYYILLVIGETSSLKTTLLDAFVNYLAGMNYEYKWGYKLVNEKYLRYKNH